MTLYNGTEWKNSNLTGLRTKSGLGLIDLKDFLNLWLLSITHWLGDLFDFKQKFDLSHKMFYNWSLRKNYINPNKSLKG